MDINNKEILEKQTSYLSTILSDIEKLNDFIGLDFNIYGEEINDIETLTKNLILIKQVHSHRLTYKTLYNKTISPLSSEEKSGGITLMESTSQDPNKIINNINIVFTKLETKLKGIYREENISPITCTQRSSQVFDIDVKIKMIPEEFIEMALSDFPNLFPSSLKMFEINNPNDEFSYELKLQCLIKDLSNRVEMVDKFISSILDKFTSSDEYSGFVYSNYSNIVLTQLYNHHPSLICVPKEFQMRKWQSDALSLFLGSSPKDANQNSKYHLICEAGTGAGKTKFALMCVSKILKENPTAKIRIIVSKIVLMHQWAEELKHTLNIPPDQIRYMGGGMCSAKDRNNYNMSFSIYVYKTAIKEMPSDLYNSIERANTSNFVIADECHHYYSPENITMFKGLHTYNRNPTNSAGYYSLALSATPYSYNYKDLDILKSLNLLEPENITRENIMYQLLGPAKYKYSLVHAIADRVVSPLKIINVDCKLNKKDIYDYKKLKQKLTFSISMFEKVLMNYNLNGNELPEKYADTESLIKLALTISRSEYKIANELREKYRTDGSTNMDKWLNTKDPFYKVVSSALIINTIDEKMKKLVNNSDSRILKCIDLAKDHIHDKVVIFAETIKSIEYIYNTLVDIFGENKVLLYHSKMNISKVLKSNITVTDGKIGKDVYISKYLEPFKNGPINILCTAKVFDEGVDIPDANVGIIFQGTESERQNIQRAGRIIRKTSDDKVATLYWFFTSECYQKTFLNEYLSEIEGSIQEEENSGVALSESAKKSKLGLSLIQENEMTIYSIPEQPTPLP